MTRFQCAILNAASYDLEHQAYSGFETLHHHDLLRRIPQAAILGNRVAPMEPCPRVWKFKLGIVGRDSSRLS